MTLQTPGAPEVGRRDAATAASRSFSRLREVFGIDLRSLALFRIALACGLLFDLATRARDRVAHYTDFGTLPADEVIRLFGPSARASLHLWLSASPAAVGALFLVAGACSLALLLGYRTRITSLLCWYLLVSLQIRNPQLAAMGGDKLLRMVLFWGLFLPLGARWSLDARRAGAPTTSNQLASLATAALLIQTALLYWATGLHKSGPTWTGGSALYYALHLDFWATSLGVWLRQHETVLPFLTHAARWFEILGPFLAFVPLRNAAFRLVAIALFTGFHLLLAASLDIGPFPFFCLIAWTAFVPGVVWDRVRRRVPESATLPPARTALPLQAVVGVLLAYVVVFVAADVASGAYGWGSGLPRPVSMVGRALRINQTWRMFSPDPATAESWPVIEGRLANGETIDPLRNAPVLRGKPELLSSVYPGFRWRLLLVGVASRPPTQEDVRVGLKHLANHLCWRWNQQHRGPERLESLRIARAIEQTAPPGQPPAPVDVITVHRQRCSG